MLLLAIVLLIPEIFILYTTTIELNPGIFTVDERWFVLALFSR